MLNPAPILHVEDSEDDQFFLQRAFQAAGIQNTVHFVNDGQMAMDYLSFLGPFADRQKYAMPCIVILDLKLPKVHGLDVLKWIRAHPEFKSIVVIILSSSPLRNDVDTAYDIGSARAQDTFQGPYPADILDFPDAQWLPDKGVRKHAHLTGTPHPIETPNSSCPFEL